MYLRLGLRGFATPVGRRPSCQRRRVGAGPQARARVEVERRLDGSLSDASAAAISVQS
jgi:hypothetical protein